MPQSQALKPILCIYGTGVTQCGALLAVAGPGLHVGQRCARRERFRDQGPPPVMGTEGYAARIRSGGWRRRVLMV